MLADRGRRAAGSQQIVDDQRARAGRDRVLMHFEHVLAVFQIVAHAHDLRRQFLGLRTGTKPAPSA
jgi:hypothetical protein